MSDSDPLPLYTGGVNQAGTTTIELTGSRKTIDLAAPRPEDIDLRDIAHGLALTCRFGGQCERFYSVAEHSLFVVDIAAEMMGGHRQAASWANVVALLHDGHEAYLGDVPTPLKVLLTGYRPISDLMDVAIAERFGVEPGDFNLAFVKQADYLAACAEASVLMPGPGWDWTREEVEYPDVVKCRLEHPRPFGLEPDDAESHFLLKARDLGLT